MLKRYQIKIYSKSNVYKHTINPNIVMSDISFSSTMNGGQGQLVIKLNLPFSDTAFIEGDVVRVTEFDENNITGTPVYLGFVSKINRIETTNTETIQLVCLGIASLMTSIMFYDGSNYSFSLNQDPAQTIKDIVNYFDSVYPGVISYSSGKIDTYGKDMNIKYSYDTCFDAIKDVVKATDFYWYIDNTGQVYFKPRPVDPTHWLTNGKDVEQLELKENVETVVNKLFLSRNGGTIKIYEDSLSQSTYGIKEKKVDNSKLNNEDAQDEAGETYIEDYKDPKLETKITLNSLYNFELINPGDTIRVLNIDYNIFNLQILKVNYSPDKITLTIEKLTSFGKEVVG